MQSWLQCFTAAIAIEAEPCAVTSARPLISEVHPFYLAEGQEHFYEFYLTDFEACPTTPVERGIWTFCRVAYLEIEWGGANEGAKLIFRRIEGQESAAETTEAYDNLRLFVANGGSDYIGNALSVGTEEGWVHLGYHVQLHPSDKSDPTSLSWPQGTVSVYFLECQTVTTANFVGLWQTQLPYFIPLTQDPCIAEDETRLLDIHETVQWYFDWHDTPEAPLPSLAAVLVPVQRP